MLKPVLCPRRRAYRSGAPPTTLLFMMALMMPIAFNAWSALLNNFVVEVGKLRRGGYRDYCTLSVKSPVFLAVGVNRRDHIHP